VRALGAAMRRPGALPLVALIATYKLGESVSDLLFKPWLVDSGIGADAIGLWVGTVGMAAGLLGSLVGGWLFARFGPRLALFGALALRMVPQAAIVVLVVIGVDEPRLAVVTALEHAAGGALTTTLFALMMASVDRRIGASHYTLLAAIEVIGKAPGPWVAGWLAASLGYLPVLCAALLLSLLPFVWVPSLRLPARDDDAAHAPVPGPRA
jgi:PAT family beta-lactamase induction signal transducer AmpG